jgi:hypothetical protein
VTKHNLVIEVRCPHCNEMLTEGDKLPLHGHVRESQKEGELVLSAVFGDYSLKTDLELKDGWIVDLFCPKCDASVMETVGCKLCSAPMASLNIEGGGTLELCTRRGCKGHALGGFGDVDEMMSLVNRMFDTPYD